MRNCVKIILLLLSVAVLAACQSDKDENVIKQNAADKENEIVSANKDENTKTVPDLSGKAFDTDLQQTLMNEGYILSIKTEYHDTVPQGSIISQNPKGGQVMSAKDVSLELAISAGKKDGTSETQLGQNNLQHNQPVQDKHEQQESSNPEKPENRENISEDNRDITVPTGKGLATPRWIISPTIDYEFIETFGKTGYSICKKWNNYGILDINCKAYGTGAYTKLFYCPEHGLSSPDVNKSQKLADDLVLVPDCGYRTQDNGNIYVYDNSRNRVYLTGYSDGEFKIADITDTEFFKTNASYIAALYNCDADLMMYDGIGMESLGEIFKAENINMHYGVVNNEFYTLVEFAYDEIRDGNDCYIVKQNGKYGYRGITGQYYYECIFEEANTAYLGAAWVKYNGKWGTVAF